MKKDPYNDKPFHEIQQMMDEVVQEGGKAYIKWTCPKCGERCMSNEPNSINLGGYLHEGCGAVYNGGLYGLLVMLPFNKPRDHNVG